MTTMDEGVRLTKDVAAVEVAPAPVPAAKVRAPRRTPRWEDAIRSFTAGEPEPIVVPWMKDKAQARAMVTGVAHFTWHRISYHGARAPLYALLFAAWAPRGAWRGIRWTYGYITDEEAHVRAREAPLGDPSYEKLISLRDRHVVPRMYWCGFLALAALTALVVAWVKLPRILVDLGALGGFVALAFAGAPRGRRMFKPAVIRSEGPQITPGIIVGALAKLKIPDLNAAIKENADNAIRWVGAGISRDHVGRGTLVQAELPPGCVGQDVLDRRDKLASALARPLGCTWVSLDPQISPGYMEIWIPDENLNRRKQAPWPYLKGAPTDYFEPFQIGTDQMNRPVLALLDQSGSIFAGRSGFGKTSGSAVVLYYSALDPTVEHWIADLAGKGDWRDAAMFASRHVAGQDDEHLEAFLYMLRDLRTEVRTRAAILNDLDPAVRGPEVRVTRATANTVPGLHPLHFFGDEVQEAFGAENADLAKECRTLAASCSKLGRALGIHMQLATQEPTQAVFPVALRRNIRLRVLYSVTSDATDKVVLGDDAVNAGISSTQFTVADLGIANVVGSHSHNSMPATVCQWANLNGPARAALATHARAVREAAGTLRGEAAGIHVERVPDVPGRDFLDDAYAVTLGRRKAWTENLLTLLAANWPGRYQGWTAEQLAASFRQYGVAPTDVHDGPLDGGKASTRKGYDVAAIRRAHAEQAADDAEDEE